MDAKQKKVLFYGGALLAGVALVSWLINRFTNFNKGTPFENTGAVGTLGNVTNQVLGGAPQAIGEKLGGALADLTLDDFDDVTYVFTFVDTGVKGAVNSGDVNSQGFFDYWRDGKRYQLKKDSSGNKVAIRG